MMQQWHAAKKQHEDGLLFFRMGDFYEFFHRDAERASELLGLTLTARSKGPDSIPMAGIPVKTMKSYVRKLVEQGEKVVICEQVEDPAEAKGIVERQITRIITPGTITEDDSLSAVENNFLLSMSFVEDEAGLAWVDLSTGQFQLKSVSQSRALDEVLALDAAELLLPESLWLEGEDSEALRAAISAPVTPRPDWSFDRDTASRELNRHFKTKKLDGFGVDEETHAALGAAGAALEYLLETQRGAIGQLRPPRVVDAGLHMPLDRATASSLELTKTLRDGSRRGSLLGTLDKTSTAMGARLLKRWVLEPLVSLPEIHRRQDAVAELFDERDRADDLKATLRDVLDLERLSARVGCGRAHPRDLSALRQSLGRLPRFAQVLESCEAPLLTELRTNLPDLSDLAAQLERALVDEPPLAVTEGGIFRDEYHEELSELRSLGQEGKGFIASFQARECEATGIANLKIGFNRVFGYYLEVTNSQRDKVPERYLRKQTLKNAERYITPELKDYEDKVLHAEERGKKLEHELFTELRAVTEKRLGDLQRTADIVAIADVLQSMARLAKDAGWVRPEVDDGKTFEIEEGCHPVVSRQSNDDPFVPNDLDLSKDRRMMLITGPNMAGKSTYIRQVALIALMAQMGSFVPARRARLGVVDRVFTRVGASDDLAHGSSTFMVEMLEVANILNNATDRSLVILDEVGRGTSTCDGLSLAWAITEGLARDTRCKTLFATHYHELTEIAHRLDGVVNYNVAVREWGDEIVFLHRIVEGGTDKSYGIHVARLAGIPSEILKAARERLDELEARDEAVLNAARALVDGEEQLSLFAEPTLASPAPVASLVPPVPTVPNPILEKLAAFDPDSSTPLEALAFLAELRKSLP